MQPNDNNSADTPGSRPAPTPGGTPRQDFSRPVGSFSRRSARPLPNRNGVDGFRAAPPAQPTPPATPTAAPKPPEPKPFKLPQPSPGFTPPAPKPAQPIVAPKPPAAPRPAPQNNPITPPAHTSSPPSQAPKPQTSAPASADPARRPQPISSRDFGMETDLESMRKDDLLGMTGSRIIPKKQKFPKGVFAIAFVSALGFIVSFFDNSSLGLFYTIIMLVDLLLIIGLFLRLEIARKLFFWLAIVTVVLNLLLAGMFFLMVRSTRQLKQDFETKALELNAINPQKSEEDQAMLDNKEQQIRKAEEDLGKEKREKGKEEVNLDDVVTRAYIKFGVTAVAYTCIAIYLSRPKVKQAFRKELK